MVPAISDRFRATERGLAHVTERRSPQVGDRSLLFAEASTTSSSTAPSTVPVFTLPSDSVKALAGLIIFLGLVILGIAAWKLRAWRIRHKSAAPSLVNSPEQEKKLLFLNGSLVDLEDGIAPQPSKVALFTYRPTPPDGDGRWVPQMKPFLLSPSSSISSRSMKQTPFPHPAVKDGTQTQLPRSPPTLRPPPPAYIPAGGHGSPPLAESEPTTVPNHDRPLPPLPTKGTRSLRIVIPPLEVTSSTPKLKGVTAPRRVPVPNLKVTSPRRTADTKVSLRVARVQGSGSKPHYRKDLSVKKLPRLVKVATSFRPILPDELEIRVGDTLRLVAEYDDGWCLVQRVGRRDSEKGVIPRNCVQDRQEIIPNLH